MKKIAAIGLLVLLLYNMFGLGLAVFLFENNFKVASPVSQNDDWKLVKIYLPSLPYSDTWENTEGIEGLVQQNGNFYNTTHLLHKNDTLYVTLKTNLVARDQFFELANMMEMITDSGKDIPESTQNKALKLLNNLLKNYISNSQQIEIDPSPTVINVTKIHGVYVKPIYSCNDINLITPPPEITWS